MFTLFLFQLYRCHLKFATEEDLFDHKKLSHGIFEHQLNYESEKENHGTASDQQTDITHAVSHLSDGENSSEDGQVHDFRYTRYNSDQENSCISGDETVDVENASFKRETQETHIVNNPNDTDHHADGVDDKKLQRTFFNILPKHPSLASSSIKRRHPGPSFHDQRFVFLTAPNTDVTDHAQNMTENRASSPKSKRKRTVPVACRSEPKQSPMSDTSTDDSDLDVYDIHKHTLKDTPVGREDGDLLEKPTDETNEESKTENLVTSPVETSDNSPRVNGGLHDVHKYVKTEWSLGPFVSNSVASPDNATPHCDGPVATSGGENEKQCLYCNYKYVDFEDYSQHYTDRHVNNCTPDVKLDPAMASQLLGEPFVTKSNKIKDILPGKLISVNFSPFSSCAFKKECTDLKFHLI